MASCAFIVLAPHSAGGDLSQPMEATLKMLGAPHSGFAPDVYVGIDDPSGPTVDYCVRNPTMSGLFISRGLVGFPILLNVMLDQLLEKNEFDYDYVGITELGVVCEGPGWLRAAMDEITEDASEYAFDIGRIEDIKEEPQTMELSKGTWIVPKVGGMGVVVPTRHIRNWRCVPYLPLYGQKLWNDLSDHLTSEGTNLIYKESTRASAVFATRQDAMTYLGFDGGMFEKAGEDERSNNG